MVNGDQDHTLYTLPGVPCTLYLARAQVQEELRPFRPQAAPQAEPFQSHFFLQSLPEGPPQEMYQQRIPVLQAHGRRTSDKSDQGLLPGLA